MAGGRGVSTSKPPPSLRPEEASPSPGPSWSWPGDNCHLRPLQAWLPHPRPLHPLSSKELHSAGARCVSPGGGWTGQLGQLVSEGLQRAQLPEHLLPAQGHQSLSGAGP